MWQLHHSYSKWNDLWDKAGFGICICFEEILFSNQKWDSPMVSSIQYVGILLAVFLPRIHQCIVQQCLTLRWISSKCSLLIVLSSVRWYLDLVLFQLLEVYFPKWSLICLEEVLSSLTLCFIASICSCLPRELIWWTSIHVLCLLRSKPVNSAWPIFPFILEVDPL